MQNYSVLMSVYYKEKAEYLELAIESMLNQTVPPEQFVIVEDGEVSYDVQRVLDRYSKNYTDLFTRVKLNSNRGLAIALNEGLLHCRNELVARMDSDDISLPERCEKELKVFSEDNRVVICGCSIDEFYTVQTDIRNSRIVPTKYEDIIKFMRKRTPFNHPTVMYKRTKVLEFGGYSRDIKRKQDFDLFSRMINGGCYVKNIEGSYLLFRADEKNYLRRKSFDTLQNAFRVYYRHWKRGGCNLLDYLVICSGELCFFLLPVKIMKLVSDKLLRG